MDTSGIQLSLMEGMDETLLLKMHQQGIRTRDDFQERSQTREARTQLARSLKVPYAQIEGIHHLNCVTPVNRAARLFQLESDMELMTGLIEAHQKRIKAFHRILIGAVVVCISAAAAGILMPHFEAGSTPSIASSGADGAVLSRPDKQQQVEPASSLQSAGHAQTESGNSAPTDAKAVAESKPAAARAAGAGSQTVNSDDLAQAAADLGPAPRWAHRIDWSPEASRDFVQGTDRTKDHDQVTLSRILSALSTVETISRQRLDCLATAAACQEELAAVPFPKGTSSWSRAAAAAWVRLYALASGRPGTDSPRYSDMPELNNSWGARGFLLAELRLANAERLELDRQAPARWAAAVKKLHHAVNVGRDELHPHPNAWAREYWLVRARLELAVAAVLSGQDTVAPYKNKQVREFVKEQEAYLRRAYNTAPDEAKAPLAWLVLELLEAQRLIDWCLTNPGDTAELRGQTWLAALAEAERLRGAGNRSLDQNMVDIMTEAIRYSRRASSHSTSEAVESEAGMRPLLMDTRLALRTNRNSLPPAARH